jgi:hypothetical protein
MRRVTKVFRASRAPEHRDPHAPSRARAAAGQPRRRVRACILSSLGAIALFAVLLPATAAAIGVGSISGTVTNAKTKAGIDGAKVCAKLEPSGTPACAEANGNGEYEITGLAEGNFEVEFTGEVCSGAGGFCETEYISFGKSSVKVEAGKITENVNAELTELPHGSISGTVTGGGSPLSEAYVCVDFFDCVRTNSKGEYSVEDLSPSSYFVSFRPNYECKPICESTGNYIPQYYNDQLFEEAANFVTVEAGKTTTDINADLQVGGEITGKVTTASLSPQAIKKGNEKAKVTAR